MMSKERHCLEMKTPNQLDITNHQGGGLNTFTDSGDYFLIFGMYDKISSHHSNLTKISRPSNSKNQQIVTVLCFLLLMLQRIINVMVPNQLGKLVDSLGQGTIPYKSIALYCLYRGLQGQQGVIGSLRAVLWIPISQSLYQRLTSATYSHVLLLSLDFHLSKRIGEVMSALGKGGALNTFLDGFAFQLFPMVLDLGIAAVWLFIEFDAFYTIIVAAVMWNYIFVTIYMAKYRANARREMVTRERNMEAAKYFPLTQSILLVFQQQLMIKIFFFQNRRNISLRNCSVQQCLEARSLQIPATGKSVPRG